MSLLLALLLCIPADTITVDDDGGPHADFTSIVAAVAAANGGDIIKVQPGDYAPFILTKNLLIMGPADGAKPTVQGRSVVHDCSGAMMAGLAFGSFGAVNIPGRLLLDDCSFGVAVDSVTVDTLELLNCEEAQVQRCNIQGLESQGGVATHFNGSRVAVVATLIRGGSGIDAASHGCSTNGAKGGTGLKAENCKLTVANSSVVGGASGLGCGGASVDGEAGDGMVLDDTQGTVRGNAFDEVGDGPFNPVTGSPGKDIVLTGGKLVISGVSYEQGNVQVGGGGVFTDAGHAEPWLSLNDGAGAGELLQLRLEGPAGTPALLFGSLFPDIFLVNKLESPLWLAADQSLFIITLVTQGSGSPVLLPFIIPANLDGLDLHVQAVFPTLPSSLVPNTILVTGPASPVIRY